MSFSHGRAKATVTNMASQSFTSGGRGQTVCNFDLEIQPPPFRLTAVLLGGLKAKCSKLTLDADQRGFGRQSFASASVCTCMTRSLGDLVVSRCGSDV